MHSELFVVEEMKSFAKGGRFFSALKYDGTIRPDFSEDVIGEQNFCERVIFIFQNQCLFFATCFAIFQNDCRMQQIHGRIRRFCSSFKDGYSTSFRASTTLRQFVKLPASGNDVLKGRFAA